MLAGASGVRGRVEDSVENRGVGRTEGTERTATVLKTAKVLGAANSAGVLQYFECLRLKNAVNRV